MSQKDQIITWLKDVHAIEQNLTSVLQQHMKDARGNLMIWERLERHLHETRRHSERIQMCLESLNESPSIVKSWAGGAMGFMEGMATGIFRDEIVKNLVAEYAMEHFEMACYSVLATAAEEVGLTEIARTCRDIFGEEAEMADWLEEQIPDVARMHLQQTASMR